MVAIVDSTSKVIVYCILLAAALVRQPSASVGSLRRPTCENSRPCIFLAYSHRACSSQFCLVYPLHILHILGLCTCLNVEWHGSSDVHMKGALMFHSSIVVSQPSSQAAREESEELEALWRSFEAEGG